jgi:hypothetical protein
MESHGQHLRRAASGRGRLGTIAALVLLFLASASLFLGRSEQRNNLLQRVGVASSVSTWHTDGAHGQRAKGPVSRHLEPISIVLLAGANERSILEVSRALLATTVGPYELIGA